MLNLMNCQFARDYQKKMLMLPSAKACIAIFKESYFPNTGQMATVHQVLLSGVQTGGQLCLWASFYIRPHALEFLTFIQYCAIYNSLFISPRNN